jgi:hypothetical protein
MISVTLQMLYSGRKYLIRYGQSAENKNLTPLPGIEPWRIAIQHVSRRYAD